MITLESLADLLNSEMTGDCMDAIIELWGDGDMPFDPEHPAIEPVLESIVEALNEEYEYGNLDEEYDD